MAAARAAAEAAERVYASLQTQLRRADECRKSILGQISSLLLESLPVELLQTVFVHVLASHGPAFPACLARTEYRVFRARAPFVLSAVCRHWRAVALRTAELWTYIALPSCASAPPARLLDCLLARSGSRPLDVFLSFSLFRGRPLWPLVRPVLAAFPRWRRARVVLPTRMAEHEYALLGQSSTVLEELYISWNHHWKDSLADWTPSPMLSGLQNLRLLHAPVSCLAPQCSLALLSTFELVVDLSDSARVASIIRRAPALRDLTLVSTDKEWQTVTDSSAFPENVCLDRLTSLTLSGYGIAIRVLLVSLKAPNLRKLVLGIAVLDALQKDGSILVLLRENYSAVETVEFDNSNGLHTLWGTTTVLDVIHASFPGVRHLVLTSCYFGDARWPRDANFLTTPHLETLTISGNTFGSADGYRDVASFIAWIDARTPFHLYIRDVRPLPAWLPLALGRIVGSEYCHIFSNDDGTELPTLGDDDDEASFTDPDDDGSCDSSMFSASSGPGSEGDDSENVVVGTANGPDWASDDSGDDDWCPESAETGVD
ncbi:hypothetical protein AURDEDRAFT_160170 [Auricularia subglabra TFB-10046 SS5]|nr:hypothetical protein AURDEDRAFT_160170 [Auricularia subglabra TFB-10046 SS5]